MGITYLTEYKSLLEKEKLLLTSNFLISYNVFKSYPLLMSQNEYLWSKGLTHSHTMTHFDAPGKQDF